MTYAHITQRNFTASNLVQPRLTQNVLPKLMRGILTMSSSYFDSASVVGGATHSFVDCMTEDLQRTPLHWLLLLLAFNDPGYIGRASAHHYQNIGGIQKLIGSLAALPYVAGGTYKTNLHGTLTLDHIYAKS